MVYKQPVFTKSYSWWPLKPAQIQAAVWISKYYAYQTLLEQNKVFFTNFITVFYDCDTRKHKSTRATGDLAQVSFI